ncbi:hypothetical protein AB0H34_00755 [Saccharopolyspora shandongensis]|uniref:hypothetical protein n=1 Tax=Saccharopolyspora shandongensis TaxID=418495 RepID=UPI0033FAFC52
MSHPNAGTRAHLADLRGDTPTEGGDGTPTDHPSAQHSTGEPGVAEQCPMERMAEAPDVPLFIRRDGFDPVPEMAALRDEDGVRLASAMFGPPVYVVARHDAVKSVLADNARFSAAPRDEELPGPSELSDEERGRLVAGNLLVLDAPEHTRVRRMLTSEFTVRRMRRLQPRIVEIVDDHLDAMEKAGPPADLVADFALPIPSLVICELLGVPYADRTEFQERTSRQVDLSLSEEGQVELIRPRVHGRPGRPRAGAARRGHARHAGA